MSLHPLASLMVLLVIGSGLGAGDAGDQAAIGDAPPPTGTGARYYIRADGNDTRRGTSPDEAWATFKNLAGLALKPGDQVLLQGGAVFTGPLELGPSCQGTAQQPVVITSDGDRRAVIFGGDHDAIRVIEARGVTIRQVNVIGSGTRTNQRGCGVLLRKSEQVQVDQVEASGFLHAGVFVDACQDVRITEVYAHGNGFAGIATGYFYKVDPNIPPSRNVTVAHCRALNNPGDPKLGSGVTGSGICFFYVEGGLIEYCEAAYNGWDADRSGDSGPGPVGIWMAFSRRVMVQHCISHDNRSNQGDGGGFDFDLGTHDSVMQFNYSYGNAGCGFLLCPYETDPAYAISNCTIRFCISENDGQKSHRASLYAYNGAHARNIQIHHNIFYSGEGRSCVDATPALPDSFHFRNNVFIVRGQGSFVRKIEGAVFQGNAYWNPDGPGRWDGELTLEGWRRRGKEMLDGRELGLHVDPRLTAPGRGEKLTDPRALAKLKAYALLEGSPLIGAALDLKTHFGLDVGDRDWFGQPLQSPGNIGPDATRNPLQAWREQYNQTTGEVPPEWRTLPHPLPQPLGPWQFRADPANGGVENRWFADEAESDQWSAIKVPGFFAETHSLGSYVGYGWYRVRFQTPEAWRGKAMRLLFGGVDEQAWVYLNGQLVGEHTVASEGKPIGVLWEKPFVVNVPAHRLRDNQPNVLIIRVHNQAANGGIWRPVLGHAVDQPE